MKTEEINTTESIKTEAIDNRHVGGMLCYVINTYVNTCVKAVSCCATNVVLPI